MSSYEIATTVISSLSLIATVFFGWQVYLLSDQANKIAKESVSLQRKKLEERSEKGGETLDGIK